MKHYIAFESSESCGKTTQINLLRERYAKELFFTKEPGSMHIDLCKKIRTLLLDTTVQMTPVSEALLFGADRYEHVKFLKENVTDQSIITDRSIFSSFAYQTDALLSMDDIANINKKSMDLMMPTLIFYFELDEQTRLERLKNREEALDRIEQKDQAYFDKLSNNFKEAFSRYAEEVIVVDASKSIEEMHDFIVKELKARDVI